MNKTLVYRNCSLSQTLSFTEKGKYKVLLEGVAGSLTVRLMVPEVTVEVYILASRSPLSHNLQLTTLQEHRAQRTISRLFFRAAVARGSVAHHGKIILSREAQKAEAEMESRALLLHPEAKAELQPFLEIAADDVSCRHAAASGPLSEEELFFLQTRSLSRKQAQDLLVEGFLSLFPQDERGGVSS